MSRLRLTDKADFGALYDAVKRRQTKEDWDKTSMGGQISREKFVIYCTANYPTLGFECDGRQIGWFLFDGKAAHIEVLPEFHGRWALLWPAALKWVFSLRDPIQVPVDIDNEKCHRFMARNNWPRVGEDEKYAIYEMSSSAKPLYQRRLTVGS